MKIWLAGKWYSLPTHVLAIYLEDKDKENIKNMPEECCIYCEWDNTAFDEETILAIQKRLHKDAEEMKK